MDEFSDFILLHTSEGIMLPVTFEVPASSMLQDITMMISALVDRPIFGCPPQCFRIAQLSVSAPDLNGTRTGSAELLFKNDPEQHHIVAINPETLEVFSVHRYPAYRCDSVTFQPMHPDEYDKRHPQNRYSTVCNGTITRNEARKHATPNL